MTSTAVVLGIGTVGTPEPPPDWDCARDAAGSAAIRKGIMNFTEFSSQFSLARSIVDKSTTVLFRTQKKSLLSEALYEKLPRLHQPLLAPLRVRNNPDHHQHPRHAGEQQPNL